MNKKTIWILAVVLIVAFLMSNQESKPKQTQVHDLSTLSYSQLESGMIYKASELVVVDSYANKTSNGKITVRYYLAVFYDCNGQLMAVSMPIYGSDDVNYQLLRYAESDTQGIGDCILNCYVKTTRRTAGTGNSGDNNELERYFMESVDTYSEVLGENLIPLEWAFTYHCGNAEDPLK